MPRFGGYDPVAVARGGRGGRQSAAVGGERPAALPVLQQRGADAVHRRSRQDRRRSRRALAGGRRRRCCNRRRAPALAPADAPRRTRRTAVPARLLSRAPASPQAMKPGTRKSGRRGRSDSGLAVAAGHRCRRPHHEAHDRRRCPIRGSAPAADRRRPRLRRGGRISPPSRRLCRSSTAAAPGRPRSRHRDASG